MTMTTATDDAVQMLQAGWTVRYIEGDDCIEWSDPKGFSEPSYRSESLDKPPALAVQRAAANGDIVTRFRTPA